METEKDLTLELKDDLGEIELITHMPCRRDPFISPSAIPLR